MWPRGRPRRPCSDATRFLAAVVAERGLNATARAAGVSPRTIGRWTMGEDRCPIEPIKRIADWLCPMEIGSLPIYRPDMAIDGGTRVGGVGDYTRHSAMGLGTMDHATHHAERKRCRGRR